VATRTLNSERKKSFSIGRVFFCQVMGKTSVKDIDNGSNFCYNGHTSKESIWLWTVGES
jgi:hypothetical protein